MKNVKMKLAVISALGLVSAQAMSLGLVNIPVAGFATSAYTRCMAQPTTIGGQPTTFGNFGSGSVGNGNPPPTPTAGANNTCALVPAPATDPTSPETGYALVTSATRTITVNNAYTGNTNINVGNVNEYVWRKPAATAPVTATPMCIYGAKVTLTNVDYNTLEVGSQRFELNDLARGGFDGLSVDAGYAVITSTASPVYRIGRTYTSVQHRALGVTPTWGDAGGHLPAANYLDLPGLGATTTAINGVNRYTGTAVNVLTANPNPTVAQQDAGVNGSWIDFNFDANFQDDDGGTNPLSAMTYVKAACTTAAPVTRTNAIRLRQTAQEKAPFISVTTTGFVPPSAPATIVPAATVPF